MIFPDIFNKEIRVFRFVDRTEDVTDKTATNREAELERSAMGQVTKDTTNIGHIDGVTSLDSDQPDTGPKIKGEGGVRALLKHPCSANPCRGRGECEPAGSRYICKCYNGTQGPNCECECVLC